MKFPQELFSKLACCFLICIFLSNDLIASARAVFNLPRPVEFRIEKDRSFKNKPIADKYSSGDLTDLPEEGSKVDAIKGTRITASREEGYLGIHQADPMRLPENDIFDFEVNGDLISSFGHVYLEYKVQGVKDGASIPKSVNDSPAYFGDAVQKGSDQWKKARIELEKNDFHQGTNHVRFTLPNSHEEPVTVKNVSLLFTAEPAPAEAMDKVERIPAEETDFNVLTESDFGTEVFKVVDIDMPSIPGQTHNVTRNTWGYFMESSLLDSAQVSIGISPAAKLNDVHVYFFDKKTKAWKIAMIEEIDRKAFKLTATMPTNTNYFAGLITAPEMPQGNAFVPTTISDIKAANPSEGMNIMQPPAISRTGEASIQYPLDIPQGRAGMSPNLALTYNSDAGTGWMGMGWNINTPSISIDSRWGVPAFSQAQEEVYLLNGSSLTMEGGEKGNRNPGTRKNGPVRFFERSMSSYREVIRNGNGPQNYVWKVVMADKTTYYYGTLDGSTVHANAVLTDGTNILRWYLAKVKDKWGNTINYTYANEVESGNSNAMKNGGRSVVPLKIEYTGFGGDKGKYSIEFQTSKGRKDATVSYKLGAKELDDKQLDIVKVFYETEEIKRFVFTYEEGDFFKTRLNTLKELRGGSLFYEHDFDYFDGELSYSATPQEIEINHFNNKILEDMPGELSRITTPLNTHLSPSPIKTTTTIGWGTGGAIGLGVAIGAFPAPLKNFTFSGRLGYSETYSKDRISLTDLNGDGIPDVVYNKGNNISYYPISSEAGSLSLGGFKTVENSGRLFKSSSRSLSYGFDFVLPMSLYYFGRNWNRNWNTTSNYMTDYNADGVMDVVQPSNGNSVVTFGEVSDAGDVSFSSSSETTPNPVFKGVTITPQAGNEEFKGMDMVRSWEAPFDGTVDIDGTATSPNNGGDGVKISIQKNDNFVGPNFEAISPGGSKSIQRTVEVSKGDLLMFRVLSNSDGQGDFLKWDPLITYQSGSTGKSNLKDGNGTDYEESSYSDGFFLSAKEGVYFEGDQAVRVSWPSFSISDLSDDLIFLVKLDLIDKTTGEVTDHLRYFYKVPAGGSGSPDIEEFEPYSGTSFPDFMGGMGAYGDPDVICQLTFEAFSYSNIDWKSIDWRPQVAFGPNSCGISNKAIFPTVGYNNFNKLNKLDAPYISSGSGSDLLRAWPQMNSALLGTVFNSDEINSGSLINRTASLVVKSNGTVLSKISIIVSSWGNGSFGVTYNDITDYGNASSIITLSQGPSENSFWRSSLKSGEIHAEFFAENDLLGEYLANFCSVGIYRLSGGNQILESNTSNFNVFCRNYTELQARHLHWGQFCWSGDPSEAILTAELESANKQVANNPDNDYSEFEEGNDPPNLGEDIAEDPDMNPENWKFFPLMAKRGENTLGLRDYIIGYDVVNPIKSLDRWSVIGTHIATYANDGAIAPGNLGEPQEETPSGSPISVGTYSAYAVPLKTKSRSLAQTEGEGLSAEFFSVSFLDSYTINNPSKYYRETLSAFKDINGDGYPDILDTDDGVGAKLTDPRGGHRASQPFSGDNYSKSRSESDAQVYSGSYINQDNRFTASGSISGSDGTGSNVTDIQWADINGDGLSDFMEETASNQVTVKLNTGRSLSSNAMSFNSTGMGLPVSKDKTFSLDIGGGLSNMTDDKDASGQSFSLGIGINKVGNEAEKVLLDLNGDNLQDVVTKSGGTISVLINTGTDFDDISNSTTTTAWTGVDGLSNSEALGISGKTAATFAFPLFSLGFAHFKMSISCNLQANFAINKTGMAMIDMTGDGVADFVKSGEDGKLEVYECQVGKSNLLKSVENPLGGSFDIDYERLGNKYGKFPTQVKLHNTDSDEHMVWDMPYSKWVMGKVMVHDNLNITGSNGDLDGADYLEYAYSYDGGIKSRREREFLGFTRIETTSPGNISEPTPTEAKIYTSNVTDYARPNDNGTVYRRRFEYQKGIPQKKYTLYHKETLEERDILGGGTEWVKEHYIELMGRTKYTYEYRKVDLDPNHTTTVNSVMLDAQGEPVLAVWDNISETEVVFPALTEVESITIPQITQQNNFLATRNQIEYDEYFNVKRNLSEGGDVGSRSELDQVTHTVKKYEYYTKIYLLSQLRTGCQTLTYQDYDPVVYCLPAYLEDPSEYPCSDLGDNPPIKVEFRKLVEYTYKVNETSFSPVYTGRAIAILDYFSKGSASGQTNLLSEHKVYTGTTNPADLRRRTTAVLDNSNRAHGTITGHRSGSSAITNIEYDTKGNVTQVKGPENDDQQRLTLDYEYDTEVEQFVTNVHNSYGEDMCFQYDYGTGNLLQSIDINGQTMAYTYDQFDRVENIFAPREYADPSSPPTITFEYHPYGIDQGSSDEWEKIPVAITNHNVNMLGDHEAGSLEGSCSTVDLFDNRPAIDLALQTATFMDGMQRVVQVKKDASKATSGNNVEQHHVTGMASYDYLGRELSKTLSIAEAGNVNIGKLNVNASSVVVSEKEYDYASRPVKHQYILESGSVIQGEINYYYGWLTGILPGSDPKYAIQIVNNENQVSEDFKDAFGNTIASAQHNGSDDLITTFTHDGLQQLEQTTDPIGEVTSFVYDNFGQLVQETHPDRGVSSFTYDACGNLVKKVTPGTSSNGITYEYDYNRLTHKEMSTAQSQRINNVIFTYGSPGDGKNGAGRIVNIQQGINFKTDQLEYDEMGNVIVEDKLIYIPNAGYRGHKMEYRYDSWGRMQWIEYPDGEEVEYSYTESGEVKSIISTAGPGMNPDIISEVLYDGFGNITHIDYGNETSTDFTYNSNTRRLENVKLFDSDQLGLLDKDFDYDAFGNVARIKNHGGIYQNNNLSIGGDYTQEFTYDDVNRLRTADAEYDNGALIEYDVEDDDLGYNMAGSITKKNQSFTAAGSPYDYNLNYALGGSNTPHQINSVSDGQNVTYQNYNTSGSLYETAPVPNPTAQDLDELYAWDEMQNLRGVKNANGVHHYMYDYNGQRVLKGTLRASKVNDDGVQIEDIDLLDEYIYYMNPYYVSTNYNVNEEASKHYYMGSQRVASTLLTSPIELDRPWSVPAQEETPSSIDDLYILITEFSERKDMPIDLDFDDLLEPVLYDRYMSEDDFFLALDDMGCEQPQCMCEQSRYWASLQEVDCHWNRVMYWYHPDYLGNVEFVTNRAGYPTQFVWYSPWGEPLVEEHTGQGSYYSPYLFNAKELDSETDNYYYGARYYDPKSSVWLSVDAMADKYPSLSPYAFVANNPIMLIDPDGNQIDIVGDDGNTTTYKPGMEYKGDDAHTAKVVAAYNEAHAGSDKGKEVIDGLVGSKSIYNVKSSESSSGYDPGGGITMDADGGNSFHEKDAGGTIYWNSEGNNVPVQKDGSNINFSENQKSPLAGLMHESAHAYDQVTGNLPTRDVMFKGLPVQEWQATHTENIIRSQMGMPLRTHYKINSYDGSRFGPPLLKMKGGSIISNYLYKSQGKKYIYK